MTRSERHEIEHECAKLVNRFYHLFNVDMAHVADMFTDDGTMQLISWKVGPGPDAMRAPLHAGSKNMLEGREVVLNTVSNIVVDVIDENNATGISVDTFWEHAYDPDNLGGRPAPISAPIGINSWKDEYRCVDGEWKFASRKMEPVFNNKYWKLTKLGSR